MEILRQIARYVEIGWAHVAACAGAPLSAPACKSAWPWATIALLVLGLFLLWKVLAWLMRPIRVWLAELRMRARERQVADADTMARYKVDDGKLYPGPTQDDVAQKIREALAQKKLDEQRQHHHQTLGNKKI